MKFNIINDLGSMKKFFVTTGIILNIICILFLSFIAFVFYSDYETLLMSLIFIIYALVSIRLLVGPKYGPMFRVSSAEGLRKEMVPSNIAVKSVWFINFFAWFILIVVCIISFGAFMDYLNYLDNQKAKEYLESHDVNILEYEFP